MAFSATDAVFEGFRVVRRNPMALVFWSLFYVVIMAVGMAVIGGELVKLFAAMAAIEEAGTPSPEDFLPVLQSYMTVLAVLMPLSLVSGAVIYAAISRAVLRPAERSFGYLRFGRDELRVLAVTVVLGLIFVALWTVAFGVVIMVGGMAVAAETPALWLVAVLLGLAAAAGMIWLAVRLSLAIPITMAERRIALFDSFRVTRGRFWPLLGMAVLAGVMAMVVGLLGSLVLTPLQFLTGNLGALETADAGGLMDLVRAAWPAILGWIVTNAVVSALQVAVIYAPFSAAYRDITAG